jgi:CCR4-NOT transcription complex subunit 7/8
MGGFPSKASYHYQTLRTNVDMLRMIQLGITLFNAEGKEVAGTELQNLKPGTYPSNITICPCTWTFNFKFSPEEDMYVEESLQLLKKAGSDFDKHATSGIDVKEFGSLLITSGLAYSDDVHWISFHSGYDFGYLAKVMWSRKLPSDEESYRDIIRTFFPNIWDIKFLLRHAQGMLRRGVLNAQATDILNRMGARSGLQDLADELGCQRIGTQHQAGSDAWLTGSVFWQMKNKIFDGQLPAELNGQMWGLTGVAGPATSATQALVLAAQGQHSAVAAAAANGMVGYMGREGGPSTPLTSAAGLASTPGPSQYQRSLTPGGGGVFGNFQYGK